jgi:hypothetical protein
MMRTIQLLTLALLATANAELFDIKFNRIATFDNLGNPEPQQFFTGNIVTDGICTVCSIVQNDPNTIIDGINSIEIVGPGGFALGDPSFPNDYGSISLNVAMDMSRASSMIAAMRS